jgi:trk system potassium uptake protein
VSQALGAVKPRPAVDLRGALALCGTLLKYLSLSALFPTAVALWYSEPVWPFLAAGAIAVAVGIGLEQVGSAATSVGFREGYLVVSLTWLLAALFGSLPYVFSGDPQLDRPLDALFESMSGFTTTGASILRDVESVNQSLLMWRQLTSWLGGMGIIVLALAVLPRLRVGGRQLLESEMPGPEMEMSDRIRSTARKLWSLYLAMTLVLIGILTTFGITGVDPRMGLFEATSAAFTTLPLGGFMPENTSFSEFAAATQWVVVMFMVVAGANFALTYRALVQRRFAIALRDEELRLYLVILAAASALLVVQLSGEGIAEGEAAVRHGVFQTVSIMTTTGFASVDYVTWPTMATMTLVLLMFVGGSAGSTSGSVKVVRHLLLGKVLRRELRQTVHPEEVMPIRFNRRPVDERTLRSIIAFVLLYLGLFVAGAGVIAIDAAIQGPSLTTLDAIAASAATIGNVGPGFGSAGPMGSYADYSDVSTVVMTVLMWLGRLEVIPLVVLATRHYWRV